jgi:hypothetical protein
METITGDSLILLLRSRFGALSHFLFSFLHPEGNHWDRGDGEYIFTVSMVTKHVVKVTETTCVFKGTGRC